jgi:hypothetical protein
MREKAGIMMEVWEFLKTRKKWWMTPLVVMDSTAKVAGHDTSLAIAVSRPVPHSSIK